MFSHPTCARERSGIGNSRCLVADVRSGPAQIQRYRTMTDHLNISDQGKLKMPIQQWEKTLSPTDAGESSTHQSGILISVSDGERMFPDGTGMYRCTDDHGNSWAIRFKHRAKQNESRITHVTHWIRRSSVKSGDRVILTSLRDGSYHLTHIPEGKVPKEESEDLSGFPEGSKIQVSMNGYERNRHNRERAIALHGDACLACNTRMADVYGEIADGFIHIHHVRSLATSGEYTPDIETDLIPLCPNCHSVVHLEDPPLSLEELKHRIEGTGR